MLIGASRVEITPLPGGELSGFALREQPATGVLDPLFAQVLYLETPGLRLLWAHCDLIGFDAAIVAAFRAWAGKTLGLRPDQVMLSATHTHAGPATLHLREAGRYDPAYGDWLLERLAEAARQAVAAAAPAVAVTGEGRLDLAVHRRAPASAHVDPRVGVVGFLRLDETWAAVVANYAMHPVALGHENRKVSGDVFGVAAAEIARELPGNPIVLLTNGACGNLNPPGVGVTPEQVRAWGGQLAASVIRAMAEPREVPSGAVRVAAWHCVLGVERLAPAELADRVEALRAASRLSHPRWREKLGRALEAWAADRSAEAASSTSIFRELELFAVMLGDFVFLGVDAELFSLFGDWLRRDTGLAVYPVGYANGDHGYVADRAAYVEGGYEVDTAHVFYGEPRFKAGALETLAACAVAGLRRLRAGEVPGREGG